MENKPKSNWRVITLLLIGGAIPALPGSFLLSSILQGPLPDGAKSEFVAEHYFETPLPIILHIVVGVMFAVLVAFQFSPSIRSKCPKQHQWSGWIVMLSCFLIAFSGLWMIQFFPATGGFGRTTGFLVTSLGVIISLGIALREILRRNIQSHRIWMMRAVAITYGAVIPSLVIIPIFIVYGDPGEFANDWARWIGLLLNLAIVEWILWRERKTALIYS